MTKRLRILTTCYANVMMMLAGRSFTLLLEPVGDAVEGLTGTLKYSTP
jgi:hypothetical protein